ncbi:MAG: SMP-30/gluconolactonase/LRE family protein [Candidatus Promineifilaceae bacterium]
MEIRHPNFTQLVDPDATLEQIATGFIFTEGPIWHPRDKTVLFSDIAGNTLYRWSAENGLETFRADSHMTNGNAYDHNGHLLSCEHATSRVSRTDLATGSYEILAATYDGKELNSPNDIVVRSDGLIYFTDPPYGRMPGNGIPRDRELPFCGVYRFDPADGRLALLADDFIKPNGLCFSLDESLLYINDTDCAHIRVFDVTADGDIVNGRLFAELTHKDPGAADGMKVDSQGNIYSCGPGGLHILTPAGDCLGVIETPEIVANFVFGDEDLCAIYATATTSLYRIRVKVPGHATFSG